MTLFFLDFFIKEYREQAWIQLKSLNIFAIKGAINYFLKNNK